MKQLFNYPGDTKTLKYNILAAIKNEHPEFEDFKNACAILVLALKVTEKSFSQWVMIDKTSSREIPFSGLEVIAQYFHLPIEALKNYKTKVVDFEALSQALS